MMTMALADRIVLMLSSKYAQRIGSDEVASRSGEPPGSIEDVLRRMRDDGYLRQWPDGRWGLTVAGNDRRNRLV